jgi:hypothetical protein
MTMEERDPRRLVDREGREVKILDFDPEGLPSRRQGPGPAPVEPRTVPLPRLIEDYRRPADALEAADRKWETEAASYRQKLQDLELEHERAVAVQSAAQQEAGRRLFAALVKLGRVRVWHEGYVYERLPDSEDVEVIRDCPDASALRVPV